MKIKFPLSLTSVTNFSKLLALLLFILLPFIGFYFGIQYQSQLSRMDADTIEAQPTPSTTTQSFSTSTPTSAEPWKHFRQSDYDNRHNLGFRLDYPGNWQQPKVTYNQTNTRVDFDEGFEITFGDFYDPSSRKIMTYDEIVAAYSVYHTVEDVTLNGTLGKKLISNTTADPGGVLYIFPGTYVIHYYLPEHDLPGYETRYPIAEEKYNRIMKSLYLADDNGDVNPINPSTGWHDYSQQLYSFQYPPDWKQTDTNCPAFTQAMAGRYTLYVCTSSSEQPRNLVGLRIREDVRIVSTEKYLVDGRSATKQITKYPFQSSYLYTVVYYMEENGQKIEIRAAGIPEEIKDSELVIVERIVDTFTLNFD